MKNNCLDPTKNSLVVGLAYDRVWDHRLEKGDPEDIYGEFGSEETLKGNSIISFDHLFRKERVK